MENETRRRYFKRYIHSLFVAENKIERRDFTHGNLGLAEPVLFNLTYPHYRNVSIGVKSRVEPDGGYSKLTLPHPLHLCN